MGKRGGAGVWFSYNRTINHLTCSGCFVPAFFHFQTCLFRVNSNFKCTFRYLNFFKYGKLFCDCVDCSVLLFLFFGLNRLSLIVLLFDSFIVHMRYRLIARLFALCQFCFRCCFLFLMFLQLGDVMKF